MYDFECAIALEATVRIIRDNVPDPELIDRYTLCLERYTQGEFSYEAHQRGAGGYRGGGPRDVGAPIWGNFNENAQFLVEGSRRRHLRIQSCYCNVISVYIVSLLSAIPGLTGLTPGDTGGLRAWGDVHADHELGETLFGRNGFLDKR